MSACIYIHSDILYSCCLYTHTGVEYSSTDVSVNGSKISLVIWDTSGRREDRPLTSSFLQGYYNYSVPIYIEHGDQLPIGIIPE